MNTNPQSRSGQALVEMIVGLVALLVIFAGLLQIARLGDEQTKVMLNARERSGSLAMGNSFFSDAPGAQFINDWRPGPDGKKHSVDDEIVAGSPTAATRAIVDPSKPNDLDTFVPGNEVSKLNSQSILAGFNICQGRDKSPNITLDPLIQHLIYGATSIRLQGDAFLVWSKNIQ